HEGVPVKNGLKTAVLLAAMAGIIMAIGSLFGRTGVTIALVISLVMIGFSYWFSDKLAIQSARAVEVTPDQLPEYYAVMQELTQIDGLPMPRLYVSPEPQPNAFATGRGPNHAAVCVTEGLLRTLSWYEIRGVLAHELSHVRNRDILIGSVAAAIATAISYAANMAMWSGLMGGSRDQEDQRNPLAAIAVMVLAPVAAGLIQMAISRSREYEADRSAARLINDGEPLAQALEKLNGSAHRVVSHVPPAQASNYIVNPLAGRRVSLAKMFSSHPSAEERIRRLRSGEWQG
ncbi:MAG: zinc metalloprotease HtpX, partial [Acidimicrobiales bacterium]